VAAGQVHCPMVKWFGPGVTIPLPGPRLPGHRSGTRGLSLSGYVIRLLFILRAMRRSCCCCSQGGIQMGQAGERGAGRGDSGGRGQRGAFNVSISLW